MNCVFSTISTKAAMSEAASRKVSARELRSLELFTGAGGLALGMHFAGFKHTALIDFNRDACRTIERNAGIGRIPGVDFWNVVSSPVQEISFEKIAAVDVVAGGPPCQPFSIGGRHRGPDDHRDMIPQFIRAIRELEPRAFIMENVKGLLRKSFSTYFQYALLQLSLPSLTRRKNESWGDHLSRLERAQTSGRSDGPRYNLVFRVANAADYGVPQRRERLFVVGFRSDTGIEWSFPDPTHSLETLFHDQWVTGEYWSRHAVKPPHAPPARFRDTIPGLFAGRRPRIDEPWHTVRDGLRDLPDPRERAAARFPNHSHQRGARAYPGHTGSPLDLPAKALKAGVHGVPGGENMIAYPGGEVRYFSVREAARVQTFPDEWEFMGSWSESMRQLGNAVPVRLAHVVAAGVADSLGGANA